MQAFLSSNPMRVPPFTSCSKRPETVSSHLFLSDMFAWLVTEIWHIPWCSQDLGLQNRLFLQTETCNHIYTVKKCLGEHLSRLTWLKIFSTAARGVFEISCSKIEQYSCMSICTCMWNHVTIGRAVLEKSWTRVSSCASTDQALPYMWGANQTPVGL